jgi:hypothetical protein
MKYRNRAVLRYSYFRHYSMPVPHRKHIASPNRLIVSTSFLRRCINIVITILGIIYRPVFYLKLNWTLQVCPYLTGVTLRLRYEPNRLLLCIGLWRIYINITKTVLDITHRLLFKTACLRLQVEPAQVGPIEATSICLLRQETSSIYWAQ